MARPLELVGERFGRLTVIAKAEKSRHKQSRWLCACECGNQVTVLGHLLRSGNTMSCGCARRLTPYVDRMRLMLDKASAARGTDKPAAVTFEVRINPTLLGALDGWRAARATPTTRQQAAEQLLAASLKLLDAPAALKKGE